MDDIEKTIPPERSHAIDSNMDEMTMPGKRDRKPDGRFAIGDLIMNRYKVLAELGQGGMGVVYKCFDETGGIEVALKALPPELSHNTLEMEDIKDNFQLVAKLVHQNIAISKNLEKDNSNGNYYLIMECCEGEDLRRWLKRKRREGNLTLDDVLPIIKQVAEALDYAHKQKIIHRDIKPGNIMISQNGDIKVLDFGLAAQIHTSMTRVSMAYHGTSGTGPYMAPEQWRGRAQGAPADQYALAVMTYELLAGHLPFESSDAAVLREAVLNDTPEKIADIPKSAQEAIKRGMSKVPAERFESCTDFVSALAGKKIKSAKTASKHNSPFKWVAMILIILLLGAGGTGYYFFDQYQKEQAFLEQLAKEKAEKERKAKIAAEKADKERIAKIAAEKADKERIAKIAAEKADKERQAKIAAEQAEKKRIAKIAAEQANKERKAKIAAEQADKERIAKIAAEKAKKERQAKIAAEQAKKERIAKIAAEQADKEQQTKLEAEKAKQAQIKKQKILEEAALVEAQRKNAEK